MKWLLYHLMYYCGLYKLYNLVIRRSHVSVRPPIAPYVCTACGQVSMVQIQLEPYLETMSIPLININKKRHQYTKAHKLFRFFYYESVKYYSVDPAFTSTAYIGKLDPKKYISNFDRSTDSSLTIHSMNDVIAKKITSDSSYQYLNKQLNHNSSSNISEKHKPNSSVFFNRVASLLTSIASFKHLKNIPKQVVDKRILASESIFAPSNENNTKHSMVLYRRSKKLLNIIVTWIFARISANSISFKKNIFSANSIQLTNMVTSKQFKKIVYNSILPYFPILARKATEILDASLPTTSQQEVPIVTYISDLFNDQLGLIDETNAIYKVLLNKQLIKYSKYFNVSHKRRKHLYKFIQVFEVIAPVNTYRIFSTYVIMKFNKYYVDIYTGNYRGVLKTTKTLQNASLANNGYYYTNRLHYLLKKKEYYYFREHVNSKRLLYSFFMTNSKILDHNTSMHEALNLNTFYYPIVLPKNIMSKQQKIARNEQIIFKDAFTFSDTTGRQTIYDLPKMSNKSIHKHFRMRMFCRNSNLLFTNNKKIDIFKEFRNAYSDDIITSLTNHNAIARMLYADMYMYPTKNRSAGKYNIRFSKSINNKLIFSNNYYKKAQQIKKKVFINRKESASRNQKLNIEKVAYIYNTYNKLYGNTDFNLQMIDTLIPVIQLLITGILVPTIIYETIVTAAFKESAIARHLQIIVSYVHILKKDILSYRYSTASTTILRKHVHNICRMLINISQFMESQQEIRIIQFKYIILKNIRLLLNILLKIQLSMQRNKSDAVPFSWAFVTMRLHSKINKIKLCKKDTRQAVLYFKYNTVDNTVNIYQKNTNTALATTAKLIFYSKSKKANDQYNETTRINNLLFKKLLFRLKDKYNINRWVAFNDLLIDLISNYKTIHRDATVYEYHEGFISSIPHDWQVISGYLAEGHYPYPRNLLLTTIWNKPWSINSLTSNILNLYTEYGFFWNIPRYENKRFEAEWLFNYYGSFIDDFFSIQLAQSDEYMNFKTQQNTIDVLATNLVLWDIPSGSSQNLYEPSYFTNKLYYLDYIDYIFFKYTAFETLYDIRIKKGIKKNMLYSTAERTKLKALPKFSWDVNSYDLAYLVPLHDSMSRYISYDVNKLNRQVVGIDRNEVSLQTYSTNNMLNYNRKIDPIVYQLTVLRWMIAHNKKMLRVEQKTNMKFTKLRYELNTRVASLLESSTTALPLFNATIERPTFNNQIFFAAQKIKSTTKHGAYDLNIVPNYIQSSVTKEIYLYRKKVSESIELEKDALFRVVEQNRLVRSIVSTNALTASYGIIYNCVNNAATTDSLYLVQLYRRNILYYNQIILPYNTFVYENTSNFLHSAARSKYEWNYVTGSLNANNPAFNEEYSKIDNSFVLPKDTDIDVDINVDDEIDMEQAYICTLFSKIMPESERNEKTTIILEIISACNKQLAEYLYTGISTLNSSAAKPDIKTVFKIHKLLLEFREKINMYLKIHVHKMKQINSTLNRLKLNQSHYQRYSFKVLQCSVEKVDSQIFAQLPMSLMLLYISGLPFVRKFYEYTNSNLIRNIDLANIPYIYAQKFNTYDKKMYKHTTYKLNARLANVSLADSTYDESIQYNSSYSTDKEAYAKLYNLLIERRLIWYLTKSIHSKCSVTMEGVSKFVKLYRSLFVKSRLADNKLSLVNLGKITNYYTAMDRFSSGVLSVPTLYAALFDLMKQQIYVQQEPVLSGYETSVAAYYKPIPFVLDANNHEPFRIYASLSVLYRWKTYTKYITYLVRAGLGVHNSSYFIRYKFHNINLDINKTKLLSKYGLFIANLTRTHINYVRKHRAKTTRYMFSKLAKIPFRDIYSGFQNVSKSEIYFSFIKFNTGVIYYLPDLSGGTHDEKYLMTILSATKDDVQYLPYFGHYFLNNDTNTTYIFDDVYITIEADAEPYNIGLHLEEIMIADPDIIVHFWEKSVELENIMLLSYLNSLFVKCNKKFNKYTVKSDSKLQPLLHIAATEPVAVLLLVTAATILDTESSSILIFNNDRLHDHSENGLTAVLKLPLSWLLGEEDEGDLAITREVYLQGYFRAGKDEVSDNMLVTYFRPNRYGRSNAYEYIIAVESEPLAILGVNINISPLFRMFTYSGSAIWDEQLKFLLLLQQYSFWGINYIADLQVFENIFHNSKKIAIVPATLVEIKDSFKNFNLHAENIPAYLQRYHRANTIGDFKKWLETYFYGLLEYQRMVPDNYDKLFSQPSIRAFLCYNFINDKEYELLHKRTLRHLSGRLYSFQREQPLFMQEEFFVYPNKRVHPVQQTQFKRALRLYNFSVPKNKNNMPRTGYEAYPYSYAQNMWYFNHRLITGGKIYQELYRVFFMPVEKQEGVFDYVYRAKYHFYLKMDYFFHKIVKKQRKKGSYLWRQRHKWYKMYSEHPRYSFLHDAYVYGLRSRLSRFFVTNTIKYNDINLLYKPSKQITGAHTVASYGLHPKISDKYLLQTQGINNIHNKIQMFPKQKATDLILIEHIYNHKIPTFLWSSIARHSWTKPTIAGVVNAYKGFSKAIHTSNAYNHAEPYGPLWSLYNRSMMDVNYTKNVASLGLASQMGRNGLAILRSRMDYHLLSFLERDTRFGDSRLTTSPSIPMIKECDLNSVQPAFYSGNDLLAAFYQDVLDIDGYWLTFYAKTKSMKPFGRSIMPILHGLHVPHNSFSLRTFTSYIPIHYSLDTKDILNSSYITTQDWYNPSFYGLFVKRHFDNRPFAGRFYANMRTYKTKLRAQRRIKTRRFFENVEHKLLSNQRDLTMKFFGSRNNYLMIEVSPGSMDLDELESEFNETEKDMQEAIDLGLAINDNRIRSMEGTDPIIIRQVNKHMNQFLDQISSFPWKAGINKPNYTNIFNNISPKCIESFRIFYLPYQEHFKHTYRWIDPTVFASTKFGIYKRADLTNPVVRTYIPNKIYNQVSTNMNFAYIYLNRYNFINIYEHFRTKPYAYVGNSNRLADTTPLINKYMDPTFRVIKNTYINLFNKILYPLESQWSSKRRSSGLVALDMYSVRAVRNRNHIRMLTPVGKQKRFRQLWISKYGRYYRGNEYYGIRPKKRNMYYLADLFKLKYYNMLKQATYYRPTKNFFPTTVMHNYSNVLSLAKGAIKLHKTTADSPIQRNENFFKFGNYPKKLIRSYLESKIIIKKKKTHRRHNAKRAFLEKVFKLIPMSEFRQRHYKAVKFRRGIPRYGAVGRKPHYYFTDRFSNQLFQKKTLRNAFTAEVIHNYGRPYRTINLGRQMMTFVMDRYEDKFSKVLHKANIQLKHDIEREVRRQRALRKQKQKPKEKINKEQVDRKPKKRKFERKDEISERLLDKAKDKYSHIEVYLEEKYDNEVSVADTTGHVFEKPYTPHNFSYKALKTEPSDTMNTFYNISSPPSTIYTRNFRKASQISTDSLVRHVKPEKYSKYMPNLTKVTFGLIKQKQNRLVNTLYNNAFKQGLKRIRRPVLQKYTHIHSMRYLHGKAYSGKSPHQRALYISRKGSKEYNRSVKLVALRDSYWQYKNSTKLEHQSNRFGTSELITVKADSSKIMERELDKIESYGVIRGTIIDKQFVYNYSLYNTKYSLPLTEYFYYTQYSKDKTNILNLHKFSVFHKNTPTIFEEQTIRVSPFIQRKKDLKILYTNLVNSGNSSIDKIEKILLENADLGNMMDMYQYNMSICDRETLYDSYIFVNSFSRPIVHWFVQIYYNNIHYFDAFYSWCCDNLSNIIIF